MSDNVKNMQDALNEGSTELTLEMILEEINKSKGAAGKGKGRKKSNSPGKKGGRLAANISREEFLEKAKKLHNIKGYTEEANWLSKDANELFSLEAFMESSAVTKDLSKIIFDTENNSASPKMSPLFGEGCLIGLHSLDNGLHFIGFSSGGDWEYPIFLIIYWDGKSFRGYIPTSGNTVDTLFGCAYGSELDSEYGPYGSMFHLMDEKYKGLDDFDFVMKRFEELGLPEKTGEGRIPMDWKALEEDIRYRIAIG